jgi:choloylglycine hydrolase
VLADEESRSLGPWELVTWMLTNFATVDEVRAALPGIRVGNATPEGWNFVPPVHYIVHDAGGNSLVIEYIAGKLNLHDDPIGVITNSPDFEWHIKNLSNYVNLSPLNVQPLDVDGLKVAQFGQGSGLLGIPGDFTPPSRFVRATVFSRSALPGENGEAAVEQAFHILDSFDIPLGDVRGSDSEQSSMEYTQWTTASDTRNGKFYFHTHDNRRIRRVDLMKTDLNARQFLTISLHLQQDVEDLTPVAKDTK